MDVLPLIERRGISVVVLRRVCAVVVRVVLLWVAVLHVAIHYTVSLLLLCVPFSLFS
jgi:hypothetical protein